LGVDVASTHFYKNNRYEIDSDVLESAGMIRMIANWLRQFPIISVEDGLAEDDW
jgi:enolase